MVKFILLLLFFQAVTAILKARKKSLEKQKNSELANNIEVEDAAEPENKMSRPQRFVEDARDQLDSFFNELKQKDSPPPYDSKDAVDREFYEDEDDFEEEVMEEKPNVYKSSFKTAIKRENADYEVRTEKINSYNNPIVNTEIKDSEIKPVYSAKDLRSGIIMAEVLAPPISLR